MIDEKLVNEEFDYNAEGELSDHLVSPGEKPKLSPNPDQSGYVKQVIVESLPESPERNVLYILNGVKYKWLVPEGWVRVFEQPNLYFKEGEHGTPVKENQTPKVRPQIFSTPVVFQEDVLYKGKKLDELGGGIEVGGIINLGTMLNGQAAIGDDYECRFHKAITKEEYDKIPLAGLAIIMFNTTCVILPYSKAQENRFVANCIYNNDGETITTRWKLTINYLEEEHIGGINVISDTVYGNLVRDSGMNLPYGIIRFIGL